MYSKSIIFGLNILFAFCIPSDSVCNILKNRHHITTLWFSKVVNDHPKYRGFVKLWQKIINVLFSKTFSRLLNTFASTVCDNYLLPWQIPSCPIIFFRVKIWWLQFFDPFAMEWQKCKFGILDTPAACMLFLILGIHNLYKCLKWKRHIKIPLTHFAF